MADRHLHPKYIPECPTTVAPVDQYMWAEKDNVTVYPCHNGISHPIYDVMGNVSYTLPLDMYPPEHGIHPQVKFSRHLPHFMNRYSSQARYDTNYPISVRVNKSSSC